MSRLPRHDIFLALIALDRCLGEAQQEVRKAMLYFAELKPQPALSHIVPLTTHLRNATEATAAIIARFEALPPTDFSSHGTDPAGRILELALAALNRVSRFKVHQHQTDSTTIAAELEALLQQIGGDPL